MVEQGEPCPYHSKMEDAVEKITKAVQETSTVAQTTASALSSFINAQTEQRKELLHALDRIHDRIQRVESKFEERHREAEGTLDNKIDQTKINLLKEINSNRTQFKEFRAYIIGACAIVSIVVSLGITWGYKLIDSSKKEPTKVEQQDALNLEDRNND